MDSSSALTTRFSAPTRTVHVHPVVLFSVLDHYLRRPLGQERVIGALLGTRTDTDVEVRSSFAVPHSEGEEQATVDSEHLRSMLELSAKVNPKEVVVGWYATGPALNAYSALIQNFFSQETAPHQAIHLTVDTSIADASLGVRAYSSAPLGPTPKPENCVFQPLPTSLLVPAQERAGLELLVRNQTSPLSDLPALGAALERVLEMLDDVLGYVSAVVKGEKQGDAAVGRALMDAVAGVGSRFGREEMERLFNGHVQDTLAVSYLASLVRTQVEISSRLNLLT